jgi:hypothetical protein
MSAHRINKDPFPIPLDDAWSIFEDELLVAHHKNGLKIFNYVLLPTRFLMIAQEGDVTRGKLMSEFLSMTCKKINKQSGRINQTFAAHHYKCELKSVHALKNCYKYIYNSPVRENLVRSAEAWQYSTLRGLLGLRKMQIPIVHDKILFTPDLNENILKWINTEISPGDLNDFTLGLKKRVFKLPRKNRYFPRHDLEIRLL